jgi:hypothetical protein
MVATAAVAAARRRQTRMVGGDNGDNGDGRGRRQPRRNQHDKANASVSRKHEVVVVVAAKHAVVVEAAAAAVVAERRTGKGPTGVRQGACLCAQIRARLESQPSSSSKRGTAPRNARCRRWQFMQKPPHPNSWQVAKAGRAK